MIRLRSAAAVRRRIDLWRRAGERIGFVPTLGALHEGHASLIRRAEKENDRVVVSVYVNPTQFGPGEDFTRYPRPLRRDMAVCRSAGVDAVFTPGRLYHPDFESWVTVERLSRSLCGPFRPGHFRGVATVVLKLLNIVRPDRAYFGEKDFQQLRIVQTMVRDLDVPVRIVPCATVREESGLALSSRNRYLSTEERAAAPGVWRALREGTQVLKSRRRPREAERVVRRMLARLPGARVQYVSVVDPHTLSRTTRARGPWRLAVAVRLGSTRLIDNIQVTL